MCDFRQTGCNVKHEYPDDPETRRPLKSPELPRVFLDRNEALYYGQNAGNDGVASVTGFRISVVATKRP